MLEEKWQQYKADGLQVFTLMGEGFNPGAPAEANELESWTDEGATFPILSDPLYENSKGYFNGEIALGATLLLAPGVKVRETSPVDLAGIEP
ncbi:MAG: hypothetical protein V3V08_16435 [Nannocystaceae bacterium]